MHGRNLEDRF